MSAVDNFPMCAVVRARARRRVVARCVIALLAIGATASAPADVRYEGFAHARKDDRLLYVESHWLYAVDGVSKHLVLYRCANGDAFARKHLVESTSPAAPDFDFVDARSGYREGVRTRDGVREAYVQESGDAPLRHEPIEVGPDAIIDAGFDAYLRSHWDEVGLHGSVDASLLIPSRFGFLDMRLSARGDERVAAGRVRRFRVTIDRWYAFALPELRLRYLTGSRQLLEFAGIGTIRDANGRSLDVRIAFPPQARTRGDFRDEIARAGNVTLAPQCASIKGTT